MPWCTRCDRWFNTQRALEQHEDNSSNHHICHLCNVDFLSAWALVQHYVQSKRHAYCQQCDEHFESFAELYEHYDDVHWWCRECNQFFKNELGLHEHRRQKHADRYCVPCKRLFQSNSNLRAHERSSVHQPRAVACPLKGCGRGFVSRAALVIHLESGACASGMTRAMVNDLVRHLDKGGVITDPARMIANGNNQRTTITDQWATQRAWNGSAYVCYLCPRGARGFRTLDDLNKHLRSACHADKIYRCPAAWRGCGKELGTLSGLVQHIESERCGVYEFKARMDRAIDAIGSGRRIAL